MSETTSSSTGLASLGFPLAAVLSYMKWHSFWLAFGHALLSWFYVFYYFIQYGNPFKF